MGEVTAYLIFYFRLKQQQLWSLGDSNKIPQNVNY